MTVKMEVFSGEPPCSACAALLSLADEYAAKYPVELEVIKYIGQSAMTRFNECGLWCTPAVVIEEMIRIEGICPSRETLDSALQEAGLKMTSTE
jgi:hypothetical protein